MIIDLVTEEQAILVREQIARLEKQLAEWVELLERWEKRDETSK